MSKPEWGAKRSCQSCAAKYYDFRKKEIRCPKCGTAFDPEATTKTRRSRPAPAPKKEKPAPVKTEVAEDDIEEADIEAGDDDSILEDASDLNEGEEEVEVEVESERDKAET